MSKENRMAAKARVQAARRRETTHRILLIVIPLIVVAAIAGIVAYKLYDKKVSTLDYGAYITADGNIEGVNPKDYITLANYKSMGITLAQYDAKDEDVKKKIESLVTAKEEELNKKTETADKDSEDTKKETEEKIDVDKILTDEYVEKNFSKVLDKDYDHTVAGFKKYVTDQVTESNRGNMGSDIAKFISENTTVKSYPKAFTNRTIWNKRIEYTQQFEQVKGLYQQMGMNVETVYDTYADENGKNGKKNFKASTEEAGKTEVKMYLAYLAIYDEMGLTATHEDVVKFFTDENTKYEDLEKVYGANYLMLQYKCQTVLDKLKESIK